MINVEEKINTDSDENSFRIRAFADTKAEVSTASIEDGDYRGLPKSAKIEIGSSMRTADGEFAYMKSDGNWNWI